MIVAESSSGMGAGVLVLGVVLYFVAALPLMGVFGKAGQPGWAAFVPIYNIWVLLKVVGRPGWWLILFLIPIVNIVIAIIVYYDLSVSFGHGVGFTVGLLFLGWIFLLILWLGSSTYSGPAGQRAATY
jgi:hypothetical protein